MSVDITIISDDVLRRDLADSEQDINNCEMALAIGMTECGGTPIRYRLRRNREFVTMITAELERRARETLKDAGISAVSPGHAEA